MTQPPPLLLLDDDPDDIFILKRLLLRAGIENKVMAFEDAAVAIEYLEVECRNPNQRFMPCVAFTDLHMPRISGLEFVRWIRARPELRKLTVAVVSSSEHPADRAGVLTAGANHFFLKYPAPSALKKLTEESGCG